MNVKTKVGILKLMNINKHQLEWVLRQMNWTQAQAASNLDYSLSHFKNLLNGQRTMPPDIRERLKAAVEREVKLNTKRYSSLKDLLDCQEGGK